MLCACGDNSPTCATQWDAYVDACNCCYAAQIFASRDSQQIAPPTLDVERYFGRWKRAVIQEPILMGRTPQVYRNSPPSMIQVNTTNELAIEAWSQQIAETGDHSLDVAISQLGDVTIERRYAPDPAPGDPWYFELHESVVYNEEALNTQLMMSSAWLDAATPLPRDDGTWTWLDASDGTSTAQIDFTFGWGDCFVACDGFHTMRAVVPEVGEATVYDLGGDPLPDYLHLDPRTRPLP